MLPSPPSTDPSSRPPRVSPGTAATIRLAMRESGSDCSQTLPGPLERREEEPLAAEERGLDALHHLDVVGHRGLEADDAAGVDAQDLARAEVALHEHPAGVDEGPAVALEPLHDEALAAEKADAEPLLEGDADAHALGGREEGVLLHDQLAAELREVHRHDAARVGRAEGDALLAGPAVLEDGHEQRLAGEQALAGAHERAHEAAGLRLRRAVAEDGLHLDAVVHVHHPAGLGDDGLLRVQLDLDVLEVLAEDLVVDFVHRVHRSSLRRLFTFPPPLCERGAGGIEAPGRGSETPSLPLCQRGMN